MFYELLACIITVIVSYWVGLRRGVLETKTKLLALPASTVGGPGSSRGLWQRLKDAHFRVIDLGENRDWRLTDVGAIKVLSGQGKCYLCKGDVYDLAEIYRSRSKDSVIDRACEQTMGNVCSGCGDISIAPFPSKEGVLKPHFSVGINFFDLLEYFEQVRGGKANVATEKADPSFLKGRRDQLEAELNEIRLTIKRQELERGQDDPYRDTKKSSDDMLPPGTDVI